jgi:hypothetical protein
MRPSSSKAILIVSIPDETLTAEALSTLRKEFLISKYSDLCELCTTMLASFRGLRKFLRQNGPPTSFLPRKNAGEDEGGAHPFAINMLCAVAASQRWDICGEISVSTLVAALPRCVSAVKCCSLL